MRAGAEWAALSGPHPTATPSPACRGLWSQSEVESQVLFQAPGLTGLSMLQEVAAAIFTAPTRTLYRKVQLQAKCQGLAGQLIPGRLPQAKAGTMVVSVGV